MKKRIKNIFLSMVFSVPVLYGVVQKPGPNSMPQLPTVSPTLLNKITNESEQKNIIEYQKQLSINFNSAVLLDRICEEIVILFNKGLVKTKFTQESIRTLTDIRSQILKILHEQPELIKTKQIAQLKRFSLLLISFIEEISKNFETVINSKFKKIEKVNFEALQKRKINMRASLQEIKNKTAQMHKKVASLYEKVEYASLTWYNIATRTFEKKIIAPFQKYHGLKVAKNGVLISAAVSLFVWIVGSAHLVTVRHKVKADFLNEKSTVDHRNADASREIAEKYRLKNGGRDLFDGHLDPSSKVPSGVLGHVTNQSGCLDSSMFHTMRIDKDGAYLSLSPLEKAFLDEIAEQCWQNYLQTQASLLTRMLHKLPSMIGWATPYTFHGNVDHQELVTNSGNYTFFTNLVTTIDQLLRGTYGLTSLIGGWALNSIKDTWGDGMPGSFSMMFYEKWYELANFLRGGAHLQQSLSFDFEPKITFDDVIGLEEVKEELRYLLMFIENSEIFIRSGRIPERGYLLTGPTRSGKSYIVEALCGEINKRLRELGRTKEFKFQKIPPFFFAKAGVDYLLAWAKSQAPIILWIDEIDLLDLQRVGDKKTLMSFLTGMGNSFDNDPNRLVIIIGCTNRPENMDFALKQYGRFGKEIRFEYPSAEYRRQFIIQQLLNIGLNPELFDIEGLTCKTEGLHFEAIKAFIKGASVKAWMHNKAVSQDLLDEVFDTEIRHILPVERKTLSETERELLATYFAGRALAHMLLETRGKIDSVTIRPIQVKLEETHVAEHIWDKEKQAKDMSNDDKIVYGQIFIKFDHDTASINTYEETMNEIQILLAGFAAEEVLYGACTYSCHKEDGDKAYKTAETIAFEGIDRKRLPNKTFSKLSEKAYGIKKECYEKIRKLLQKYKPALEQIKQALVKKYTLRDVEILRIVEEYVTNLDDETIIEEDDQESTPVSPE
ncbi:AAA family ATPase [bacterium]|nr:MAG: AAA family ATPase [bacterium]